MGRADEGFRGGRLPAAPPGAPAPGASGPKRARIEPRPTGGVGAGAKARRPEDARSATRAARARAPRDGRRAQHEARRRAQRSTATELFGRLVEFPQGAGPSVKSAFNVGVAGVIGAVLTCAMCEAPEREKERQADAVAAAQAQQRAAQAEAARVASLTPAQEKAEEKQRRIKADSTHCATPSSPAPRRWPAATGFPLASQRSIRPGAPPSHEARGA